AAFMTAARGAVAQLDPDVVHAHWWLPGGLAGAATIAGKHRHRFVITLHGTDVALLRNGALRRLARGVTGRANVVAAVSQPLADQAADALGRARTVARMPVQAGAGPTQPLPGHPPVRPGAGRRQVRGEGVCVLL